MDARFDPFPCRLAVIYIAFETKNSITEFTTKILVRERDTYIYYMFIYIYILYIIYIYYMFIYIYILYIYILYVYIYIVLLSFEFCH